MKIIRNLCKLWQCTSFDRSLLPLELFRTFVFLCLLYLVLYTENDCLIGTKYMRWSLKTLIKTLNRTGDWWQLKRNSKHAMITVHTLTTICHIRFCPYRVIHNSVMYYITSIMSYIAKCCREWWQCLWVPVRDCKKDCQSSCWTFSGGVSSTDIYHYWSSIPQVHNTMHYMYYGFINTMYLPPGYEIRKVPFGGRMVLMTSCLLEEEWEQWPVKDITICKLT